MTRPENSNEQAVEPKEYTLQLSDLKRLSLEPGEALLIRFPRNMDGDAVRRAMNLIKTWLDHWNLDWPVLYSRDDVEFVVINQPEQKLGSRPQLETGIFDGDEQL